MLDAACFVYTCQRLIDLSLIAGTQQHANANGRSPIDWIFERADFAAFQSAALLRKRATVRFRLEEESKAPEAGVEFDGPRLQNRLQQGAKSLLMVSNNRIGQLQQIQVKEKLGEFEKSVDGLLGEGGGLDQTLETLETSVDMKLFQAADKMEEQAGEMIAVASLLGKRVGGTAKGFFGRAKAAAADKMATMEQEWQLAAEEQERAQAAAQAAGGGEQEQGGGAGGGGERLDPYVARAWPRHYVCVERAIVRGGWQSDSEKLGEMEIGALNPSIATGLLDLFLSERTCVSVSADHVLSCWVCIVVFGGYHPSIYPDIYYANALGTELDAVESVSHPVSGVERVRFTFKGQDAWTSVASTNGVMILEPLSQ